MAGFLKGGKFGKPSTETTETTTNTGVKPSPFGKKKLGSLSKPKVQEPDEITIEDNKKEMVEETKTEAAPKPKLGAKKKLGGLKATPEQTQEEKEEMKAKIAAMQDEIAEAAFCGGIDEEDAQEAIAELEKVAERLEEPNEVIIEEKEEEKPVAKKATAKKSSSKKSASKKKATPTTINTDGDVVINTTNVTIPVVDETKRIGIAEMDAIMRPIVAPTTEAWEQEKTDVLEALNDIKVDQDMTMEQVKNALAELDSIRFEILPKYHDAETMFDGTKQNYDKVKAIGIANGNATNAEGRKAEGILACQNYVTPSGEVVDLNQYMLLIEERFKFYEKIIDGINFKKYSLVNYNNALKIEARDI